MPESDVPHDPDENHRRSITADDPLDVLASPSAAPPPDPVTGEVSGSGGWGLGANNAAANVVPGRDATPLTRTGDAAIQAGRTSDANAIAGGGATDGSPRRLTVPDGELDPPAAAE